ncbi:hypothetical protein LXL04_020889 [Taraxacum kok-saghyz]
MRFQQRAFPLLKLAGYFLFVFFNPSDHINDESSPLAPAEVQIDIAAEQKHEVELAAAAS